MIASLSSITFDCPDPQALASFYQVLVGGVIDASGDGWVTLTVSGSPALGFQLAPDHRPPRWPEPDHPQQLHLDLQVTDLDETQALALGAGAQLLADRGGWRVFADPAGHPFCLCR